MTTAVATPITSADRCDRCGAQAYIRATLANGGSLLFCAHHGREHAQRLTQMEAVIHDETARLSNHDSVQA